MLHWVNAVALLYLIKQEKIFKWCLLDTFFQEGEIDVHKPTDGLKVLFGRKKEVRKSSSQQKWKSPVEWMVMRVFQAIVKWSNLWSRSCVAEGSCTLCPTVTHQSLEAIESLFIPVPVGQEHYCTNTVLLPLASTESNEVQDLWPGAAFPVDPTTSQAQLRHPLCLFSHGSQSICDERGT